MPEPSPLETLEQQVMFVEATRAAREETLHEIPRWRFRRRRRVAESVRRRQEREEGLKDALVSSSASKEVLSRR